jgi:hypothetical protein
MPDSDRGREHAIREAAYFIWLREGDPTGPRTTIGNGPSAKFPVTSATVVPNYWRMRNGF